MLTTHESSVTRHIDHFFRLLYEPAAEVHTNPSHYNRCKPHYAGTEFNKEPRYLVTPERGSTNARMPQCLSNCIELGWHGEFIWLIALI